MKKEYKYLIVFLLMFASLFLFIPLRNERCFWQSEFNKKRFCGVVTNKFIDLSQHSTPILEIKELSGNGNDSLSFLGETSNVFNLINKYDTIYKSINTNKVYFLTNKKMILIGSVDFGCDDSKKLNVDTSKSSQP